ncbi:MAG: hypothetical protein J6T10_03910 [Methanobrevibacter sp.]|nr:hypothetical protein [Methanobrevibacter sp.]
MNALSAFDDESVKEILNEYAMVKHFNPLEGPIDASKLHPNIAENFREQFRTVIWNGKPMDIDKIPVKWASQISQPTTPLALPYYINEANISATDAMKVEMFTKNRTWKEIADEY